MLNRLIERLYWRRLEKRTSNLVSHAKRELALLGGEDCEMQQAMNKHIIKMLMVFADEGHSGFSASYARGIISDLLAYKPLTPLTGEDSEWVEVSEGTKQNNRHHSVFMENGKAYDIDGRVFEDASGSRYTNYNSRVNVTFPYTPKTEIVKVAE